MTDTPAPLRALRPAGAHAAAALVFLALGGILFWPTLREGYWAFGTDTIAHDLVCEAYGWSVYWTEGEVPWWGYHLRAGQPMLGSFAFMPFYPPNWVTGLVVHGDAPVWVGGAFTGLDSERLAWLFVGRGTTLPRAHTLQWVLHLTLGAWFIYRAVRARGAGWTAGVLGGIVFGFSSHVATLTYAGHLAKVQAIAWLPAVVWAVEAAGVRRGLPHVAAWLGAAAALAMQWLAGHPQIWAYTAGLALTLAATRAWWDAPVESSARDRILGGARSIAACVGAIALSLLLAAPMSLSAFEFAPHSNRASLTYDEATKSSYPPEELWELVAPRAAGDSVMPALGGTGSYRGRWGERIVSDYLGVPVVALALAGLILGAGWRRWFWATVAVGATVLSLGAYTGPLYRILLAAIPPLGAFRSPATIMVLIPLGAAFLAAEGWSALTAREALCSRSRLIATRAIALALGLAAMSPLPRWTIAAVAGPFTDTQSIATHASARHVSWAVLAAAGLVALGALSRRWPVRLRAVLVGGALLAVVAADLLVAARFFVRPAPEAALHGGLALHGDARALRVDFAGDQPAAAEMALPPGILLVGREINLWPMLAGWRVPHAYHPITYERLEERMRALGHDSAEFLDIAGVRAVVSPDGMVTARAPLAASAPAESGGWSAEMRRSSRLHLRLPAGATSACLPLMFDEGWRLDPTTAAPAAPSASATLRSAYWGMGTTVELDTPAPPDGATVSLIFAPASRRWGPTLMLWAWAAAALVAALAAIPPFVARVRSELRRLSSSAALDSPPGAP